MIKPEIYSAVLPCFMSKPGNSWNYLSLKSIRQSQLVQYMHCNACSIIFQLTESVCPWQWCPVVTCTYFEERAIVVRICRLWEFEKWEITVHRNLCRTVESVCILQLSQSDLSLSLPYLYTGRRRPSGLLYALKDTMRNRPCSRDIFHTIYTIQDYNWETFYSFQCGHFCDDRVDWPEKSTDVPRVLTLVEIPQMS
jgi:hypothetical protein